MTKLLSDSYFQSDAPGRRRKLLRALVLGVWSAGWSTIGHADTRDTPLYREVLKVIFEQQRPETFAVWDRKISVATMTTPRVPRHNPDHQLVRSLRGLPSELERTLLASVAGNGVDETVAGFEVPASAATFSGFLDSTKLKQAETAARPNDGNSWLTAIGFSRVAYADKGRNGLVYAETCLNGSDELCGAEGFWFVKSESEWRLKRHAGLWQGVTQPFWNMPATTAVSPSE